MKKRKRKTANAVPIEEILRKEEERCPTVFSKITIVYSIIVLLCFWDISIWIYLLGLAFIWGVNEFCLFDINKRRWYIYRRKVKLRNRISNGKIILFPPKETSTIYNGEK